MQRLLSSLTLSLLLTGCSMQTPYARINDVSLAEGMDAGYLLVSIDGNPVRRISGSDGKIAPNAIVTAGKHTFELQNKREPQAPPTKITAEVKPEREYRFAVKDNSVILVETYAGQAAPQNSWEGGWIIKAILGT